MDKKTKIFPTHNKELKTKKNRKKPAFLIAFTSSIISVLIVSFFVYLHTTQWAYKQYVLPLVYFGIIVFLFVLFFVHTSQLDHDD